MKTKRMICAGLLLALCLLLIGCGKISSPALATPAPPTSARFSGGEVAYTATELKMKLASGETELLDSLTALRTADFSGSENEEEVAAWAKTHPGVQTIYTVTLPGGTVLDSGATSADLSGLSAADCEAAARKLALLPAIASVNLGAEGGALSWNDIARLREILPGTTFKYAFKLYGKDCNLADTTIDLFRVQVPDNGNLIDQVMGYMPQLTYVDMDSCGLDPKRLEEINLRHPDAKVVFRVYFGDNYTARTDAERILASMASRGGMLTDYNVDGLYYCHDVKYLDLGHNTELTNIGFVAQMPKLEVAILAMCNISNITPLASCPELEYLELANTYASDLRPLSGLSKLRHLNVASIGYDQPWDGSERIRLTDITPLYPLTKLERLWIGAYNPVPAEQVEEMQRRAPNCEINLTVYEDPVGGRWRYVAMADYMTTYVDTYHERYVKLRQQFGDYAYEAFNFTWNDPLCDPNYDPATATPKPSPTPAPAPVQYYPPAAEDETEPEDVYVPPYDPFADNNSNQNGGNTGNQTGDNGTGGETGNGTGGETGNGTGGTDNGTGGTDNGTGDNATGGTDNMTGDDGAGSETGNGTDNGTDNGTENGADRDFDDLFGGDDSGSVADTVNEIDNAGPPADDGGAGEDSGFVTDDGGSAFPDGEGMSAQENGESE